MATVNTVTPKVADPAGHCPTVLVVRLTPTEKTTVRQLMAGYEMGPSLAIKAWLAAARTALDA